ncbi:MAG: hypothetical protein RR420_05325 [Anaerovoracaceae bacterium]
MDVICLKKKCRHYFENICAIDTKEKVIILDEEGKCTNFAEGKSILYNYLEKYTKQAIEALKKMEEMENKTNDNN